MDARELRIGNIITDGVISPVKVSAVFQTSICGRYIQEGENKAGLVFPLRSLQPVSISEQWLLDFGFYKHKCQLSGADMWQGMDGYSIPNPFFSEWLFRGYNIRGTKSVVLKLVGYFNSNIEHVHQLQNLYFSLTGEELTLKK